MPAKPSISLADELELSEEQLLEKIAEESKEARKKQDQRAKRPAPFGAVGGRISF
jgi:hypothetical protein